WETLPTFRRAPGLWPTPTRHPSTPRPRTRPPPRCAPSPSRTRCAGSAAHDPRAAARRLAHGDRGARGPRLSRVVAAVVHTLTHGVERRSAAARGGWGRGGLGARTSRPRRARDRRGPRPR